MYVIVKRFNLLYTYMYTVPIKLKVTIQYSNYLVVSLSHYSSSTVVLTVIGVHVLLNSIPQ